MSIEFKVPNVGQVPQLPNLDPKGKEIAKGNEGGNEEEKYFGNKLQTARNVLGVSQSVLAKEFGFKNPTSIARWEEGWTFPENRLSDIARVYKIDLGELTEAFLRSKSIHDKYRNARKNPRFVPKPGPDTDVYGPGAPGRRSSFVR